MPRKPRLLKLIPEAYGFGCAAGPLAIRSPPLPLPPPPTTLCTEVQARHLSARKHFPTDVVTQVPLADRRSRR